MPWSWKRIFARNDQYNPLVETEDTELDFDSKSELRFIFIIYCLQIYGAHLIPPVFNKPSKCIADWIKNEKMEKSSNIMDQLLIESGLFNLDEVISKSKENKQKYGTEYKAIKKQYKEKRNSLLQGILQRLKKKEYDIQMQSLLGVNEGLITMEPMLQIIESLDAVDRKMIPPLTETRVYVLNSPNDKYHFLKNGYPEFLVRIFDEHLYSMIAEHKTGQCSFSLDLREVTACDGSQQSLSSQS